jgi:hypothetical protein
MAAINGGYRRSAGGRPRGRPGFMSYERERARLRHRLLLV